MNLIVNDTPVADLDVYARIPIAFEVDRVLDVDDGLRERSVDPSWIKDYDTEANGPASWPRRFDISRWRAFRAIADGRVVGAAVVAFDTPGIDMLEGRTDLAVLWDIRVAPDARRRGVGAAVFRAVETWARARGCRQLKIETQNVNVPACRFYARMRCWLGAIDRLAYPDLRHEVQLLWYRDLDAACVGSGEVRGR